MATRVLPDDRLDLPVGKAGGVLRYLWLSSLSSLPPTPLKLDIQHRHLTILQTRGGFFRPCRYLRDPCSDGVGFGKTNTEDIMASL